jgi:hypothetical protein
VDTFLNDLRNMKGVAGIALHAEVQCGNHVFELGIMNERLLIVYGDNAHQGTPGDLCEVIVPNYDPRYKHFQQWCEANIEHLVVTATPSEVSDKHLICIYDNGPEVEVKDADGEVIVTDGGNFGYCIDLGMPEFAEWTHVNAPLHGESYDEFMARLMEFANGIRDFLGPDGWSIDAVSGITTQGKDLPVYTREQIEAVRKGAQA